LELEEGGAVGGGEIEGDVLLWRGLGDDGDGQGEGEEEGCGFHGSS
jgi:hypothetical protein